MRRALGAAVRHEDRGGHVERRERDRVRVATKGRGVRGVNRDWVCERERKGGRGGPGAVGARLLASGDREVLVPASVCLCLSVLGVDQAVQHADPRIVCSEIDIEIAAETV